MVKPGRMARRGMAASIHDSSRVSLAPLVDAGFRASRPRTRPDPHFRALESACDSANLRRCGYGWAATRGRCGHWRQPSGRGRPRCPGTKRDAAPPPHCASPYGVVSPASVRPMRLTSAADAWRDAAAVRLVERRPRYTVARSASRSSAIWIALSAAPLRRLSQATKSARPFSTVGSSRIRPTSA